MASLEELLNSSLSGIIGGGGLPLEEDLFQRQAQAEREGTFGRGLGISTVTRDALAKARTDAALAAQSAQLAALGQAAGITQANANRAQQASQFGQSMDQRKRELGQQESLANKQMLASGLGAGVGAGLNLFGMAYRPQIQDFLGVKRGPGGGTPTPGAGSVPAGQQSTVPSLDYGGAGEMLGVPSLDALASIPDLSSTSFMSGGDFGGDFGGGAFAAPSFDLGDFSLDLSGLFDAPSFTPYEYGYL